MMIKFYYNLSPNPMKVALFLEEAELPYEAVPVDTRKGEQFAPAYLAINPNGKVPAVVDGDATVFDSNAILLYLAEKTGRFLPQGGDAARAEMLSWLMFIATGVGPFSGQAVHFTRFAPEKVPYAVERYLFEAERHGGLGLGPHGALHHGRRRLGALPEREAPASRDRCAAGRGARQRVARAARLQGRDGRRGPPPYVPPPRAAGRCSLTRSRGGHADVRGRDRLPC
jgi:hypothetical protein